MSPVEVNSSSETEAEPIRLVGEALAIEAFAVKAPTNEAPIAKVPTVDTPF